MVGFKLVTREQYLIPFKGRHAGLALRCYIAATTPFTPGGEKCEPEGRSPPGLRLGVFGLHEPEHFT